MIEEIKKATIYYSTINLLERYDNSPRGKVRALLLLSLLVRRRPFTSVPLFL